MLSLLVIRAGLGAIELSQAGAVAINLGKIP